MIDIKEALDDLRNIVNRNIHEYLIPEQQDNVIKLGHVVIRYSKQVGYLIFDTRKQEQKAVTYSKYAALAYAKKYMLGQDTANILILDKCIEKNETDIEFFQYTIDHSQSDIRKYIAVDRCKNCEIIADNAKQQLEILIFDK